MKVLLILGVFFIALLCLFSYFDFQKGKEQITILFTNTINGYTKPRLFPSEFLRVEINAPVGGSAYLASYIKDTKTKDKDFLLLDSGDIFLGTPEGYFSKGRVMIEIMNTIGYDALTVGDFDFYFGADNLRDLASFANFPFLGANIVEEDTGLLPEYIQPYIIKECGKIKVGIIGITLPDMERRVSPEKIQGLKFVEPASVLRNHISSLEKRGIELIIVLSHLGFEGDKELAKEVSGIDVIIGNYGSYLEGRWFESFVDSKNKTIICYIIEKGFGVGYLALNIDPKKGMISNYVNKWNFIWLSKKFIPSGLLPKGVGILKYPYPDSAVKSIVEKYINLADERMDRIIGYVETSLIGSPQNESSLGNWIADVMRKKASADIAFCGGLESDLEKGKISLKDIYNILPFGHNPFFNNTLVVMELKGEQIRGILEHSVSWALENSKYGILQVSGLKMIYDPKKPRWHRVTKVTINEEELDPDKIYKVAVNGFLTFGDRYYDIAFAKDKIDTGILIFDCLIEDIKSNSPLEAKLEGRIISQESEEDLNDKEFEGSF